MAYDYVAESRQLIAEGLPARAVSLSRRRRFAPLAVDVDGDVAATRFVRRGVACFWDDTHLLTRDRDGVWHGQGGGGGSSDQPWSTAEFEQARADLAAGAIEVNGGASVRVPPWVRTAALLAGPDVAVVRVDERRDLLVPPHGRLIVVWSSRRAPVVVARDATGRELTAVNLRD